MDRRRPRRRWNLRWRPTDTDTRTGSGRVRPSHPGPAAGLPEATHVPRSLR